MIDRLETEIMCRGATAYEAVASPTRLMSVSQSVYFVTNLLSTMYVDPAGASNWQVTSIADQIALEQVVK